MNKNEKYKTQVVKEELERLPYLSLLEKVMRTIARTIEMLKPFIPREWQDSEEFDIRIEKEFAKKLINQLKDTYNI